MKRTWLAVVVLYAQVVGSATTAVAFWRHAGATAGPWSVGWLCVAAAAVVLMLGPLEEGLAALWIRSRSDRP